MNLTLKQVDEAAFQQHLAHIYQSKSSILDAAEGMEEDMDLSLLASQLPVSEDLLENQDDAPIIRLLNALFTQAIKQKASDIHIETYEDRVLVRNRIDGVLHEVLEIQRAIAPLVISTGQSNGKIGYSRKTYSTRWHGYLCELVGIILMFVYLPYPLIMVSVLY